MSEPRTVLHLVGSPVDEFHGELSRLYASASIAALEDSRRYRTHVAHVAPGGRWCFPEDLSPEALDDYLYNNADEFFFRSREQAPREQAH